MKAVAEGGEVKKGSVLPVLPSILLAEDMPSDAAEAERLVDMMCVHTVTASVQQGFLHVLGDMLRLLSGPSARWLHLLLSAVLSMLCRPHAHKNRVRSVCLQRLSEVRLSVSLV